MRSISFWVVAAGSFPFFLLCSFWVELAYLEEETEQGKAEAAGTSMAGFGFFFGVVPVLGATVILFFVLLALWRHPRLWVRALVAAVVVVVTAGLGFLLLDPLLTWYLAANMR